MGNKIAKEFNDTFDEVKTFVVHDTSQGKNKNKVLLCRDYVDPNTDKTLLHIDYNKDSEDDPTVARSVASDADGYILYADKVVVTEDNQKRVMIYTPSPVFPNQRPAKDTRTNKGDPNHVYLAAVVFHHHKQAMMGGAQGPCYLCVVTGENRFDETGFELQDFYKAVRNPNVKNGIVVADMEGRVVGKASAARSTTPKRSPPRREWSSSSFASISSMDSVISCDSTTSSFSSLFSGKGEKTISYEIAAGAQAAAAIVTASSFFN